MVGTEGLDGVQQAITVYTTAPNWMSRVQPLGTPGTNVAWDGAPQWRGFGPTSTAKLPHVQAGESLNSLAMRAWFLPRYQHWKKEGASAAITLEEVVAVLSSDAVWEKPISTERKLF